MTIAQTLARTFTRALGPDAWGRDVDWSGGSSAGVPVNAESAVRLPAIYSGLRQLVSDISTCPVDIVRKVGNERLPMPKPDWMRAPTGNPNDTWQDHVSDAVASLVLDGNLFMLALPYVEAAEMLLVLDPSRCAIVRHRGRAIAYYVDGVEVFPDTLIHKALIRVPGKARGIGLIEAGREAIGEGLAAQEYAARFFSNGALLDVVIEVPAGTQDPDIKRLVQMMRRRHTGVRNSHAIGALTGGAKINRMGANPQEAQLLELRRFNVQDDARLLNMPSFALGDVTPGAVSYASSEVSDRRYLRSGVTPIVSRVEDAHQRLLPDDQQYRTNLSGLLRGDLKARWETYQIGINSRVLTVDEVRAWEDLPPADKAAGIDTENGGFVDTPNNTATEKPAEPEAPKSADDEDPDKEPDE
ncbi:MAG: phage portal protein [Chloroflexi bacterium]|nr:phage portal protein [Chloroflexota bacterium]